VGTSNASAGLGVSGSASVGTGVEGDSTSGIGVRGTTATGTAVSAYAPGGVGIAAASGTGTGIRANSTSGNAIVGTVGGPPCDGSFAVGGCAGTGTMGVMGTATNAPAIMGQSGSGFGVEGTSNSTDGVVGLSGVKGVVGAISEVSCPGVFGTGGCAGSSGDGLFGEINHPAGGSTAAAVHAVNLGTGDIFLGQSGTARVARIDGNGKGYFDGGTQNSGADYADSLRADSASKLRPGDVLAIDPRRANTVGLADRSNSTLVAGVYSTKPAVLGVGSYHLGGSLRGRVPVALVGVVPTRVSAENGPVHAGDLMTTSSTPGYAMKAKPVLVNGARSTRWARSWARRCSRSPRGRA